MSSWDVEVKFSPGVKICKVDERFKPEQQVCRLKINLVVNIVESQLLFFHLHIVEQNRALAVTLNVYIMKNIKTYLAFAIWLRVGFFIGLAQEWLIFMVRMDWK